MMKILLATGGTGGHIFPALKVAQQLKALGHEVCLSGSLLAAGETIKTCGIEYHSIEAKGMVGRSFYSLLKAAFKNLQAIRQAIRFIQEYRPQVVCGFGGYGAFGVVLAAKLLNCPTMIHEQNVVPGKANRLLSFFVKKIALTFKESQKFFKSMKTVVTGCPTNIHQATDSKEEILKKFNLNPGYKTILVFGGSQGSQSINQSVFAALSLCQDKKEQWQIIHLTGKKDYASLKDQYLRLFFSVALFEFMKNMSEAYLAADLVIARAGALTVLEIAQCQKPAILIPYPFAGGHQKENALLLSHQGLACLIEEKDLNPQLLLEAIQTMLNKPVLIDDDKSKKADRSIYIPEAVNHLVKEILLCAKA